MSKENKIKVFVINPTTKKLSIVEIDNDYKAMQKIVEGPIECGFRIPVSKMYEKESGIICFDVYVNEEGRLNDIVEGFQILKHDRTPLSNPLVGKGLIVGANAEGEAVSVDAHEMGKFAVGMLSEGDEGFNQFKESMWL
jgi:hypothetical protein